MNQLEAGEDVGPFGLFANGFEDGVDELGAFTVRSDPRRNESRVSISCDDRCDSNPHARVEALFAGVFSARLPRTHDRILGTRRTLAKLLPVWEHTSRTSARHDSC